MREIWSLVRFPSLKFIFEYRHAEIIILIGKRNRIQKKIKFWTKLEFWRTACFIPIINEINNANKKGKMDGGICTGIPREGQPKKSQKVN